MFRAKVLLPLAVFIMAVAIGCTQRPPVASSNDRGLEAKVAKLEKDLKSLQDEAAKARNQAALQIADLTKERDDIKSLLKARTGERDSAQAQLDGFRKELKDLLGKVEAAANVLSPSAVTALPAPNVLR